MILRVNDMQKLRCFIAIQNLSHLHSSFIIYMYIELTNILLMQLGFEPTTELILRVKPG